MVITSLIAPATHDNPIFAEIGKVASAWANFEHELDVLIMELADCDRDKGLCILTQFIGSGPRIRAVVALLHQNGIDDQDIIADASKLGQKDHEISAKRNRIIHDPWLMDAMSGETYRHEQTTSRNSHKIRDERIRQSKADLEAVLKEIQAHTERLRAISGRLAARYPSLICKRWITRPG